MKTQRNHSRPRLLAFTLIELLVVIAIIGILAALIFPAFAAVKRQATIKKARTQLESVAFLIDTYKTKFGYYPPDNKTTPNVGLMQNSLYFELSGVILTNGNFVTLDRVATIPVASIQATFGQGGILNCTKGGADDNGQPAVPFLKELKPGQYTEISTNVRILTCGVEWPASESGELIAGIGKANPWRYMVTGATNNPGRYDLWVDIVLNGKTNRIGNWNAAPTIVYY